ncbi:PREDICTED: putative F-box protein At1g32420 [Nicotiana attenuata]|uniref:F-boxkelch-repeat protein n=1 Tax=Nicotiana attenuata TaxID=49451 RepID=A0A1J6IP71_NICAT|nr:PREDICTED: putative F-box protein At1g32420 [Nicotiana attenuata]OIT06060.1 f-boxkelch-repeat protein [Nicotiana attenuata]
MPPSKGKGKGKKKGKSKKTKDRAPDATCNCILLREIIIDILSRLPVKTLLQFRCVCKPWRKLISKPNFIDTHFLHSSSLQPSTGSLPVLLHNRHLESSDHRLSLINLSPESSSVVEELDNPFPFFLQYMVVVGSCNGIVCLCQAPLGDSIILWNPAMRQSRDVPLSKSKPIIGTHPCVSIGLAYDSQKNDFLVLSLKSFGPQTMIADEVEMFSTKSFSWERVPNEMGFRVVGLSCHLIIKGVPYWVALLDDAHGSREVLVYFDVTKRVLDKLHMPGVRLDLLGHLVNLEDSLGILLWDKTDKYNVEIWVMDDEDGWSKKCNVEMLFGFDRIIGCSRNGNIVAEDENGVLFLVDPVTSSIKAKLCTGKAKSGFSMIFNYSESLVLIEGMRPVKKQAARDKLARAGMNIKFTTT